MLLKYFPVTYVRIISTINGRKSRANLAKQTLHLYSLYNNNLLTKINVKCKCKGYPEIVKEFWCSFIINPSLGQLVDLQICENLSLCIQTVIDYLRFNSNIIEYFAKSYFSDNRKGFCWWEFLERSGDK